MAQNPDKTYNCQTGLIFLYILQTTWIDSKEIGGEERIQEIEEQGLHSHSHRWVECSFYCHRARKFREGENYLYKHDSSSNQVFLGGYGAGSHSYLSEKHFGDLIMAFSH